MKGPALATGSATRRDQEAYGGRALDRLEDLAWAYVESASDLRRLSVRADRLAGYGRLRDSDGVARAHVRQERTALRVELIPRQQRAVAILEEAARSADQSPRLVWPRLDRLLGDRDRVGVVAVHVGVARVEQQLIRRRVVDARLLLLAHRRNGRFGAVVFGGGEERHGGERKEDAQRSA